MFEKIVAKLIHDAVARWLTVFIMISIPLGLSTSIISAVHVSRMTGFSILHTTLITFVLGTIPFLLVCLSIFLLVRNTNRVLFYVLCVLTTIPATQVSIEVARWLAPEIIPLASNPNIPIAYYATYLAGVIFFILAYELVDRVFAEFAAREEGLANQVVRLEIKINELERKEAVNDLTQSDAYLSVKQKAQEFRSE